jgi:hypothetical protein
MLRSEKLGPGEAIANFVKLRRKCQTVGPLIETV